MKRTTRLVALLLMLVMTLSIVACSDKTTDPLDTTATGEQTDNPTTTSNDTLVVGYD